MLFLVSAAWAPIGLSIAYRLAPEGSSSLAFATFWSALLPLAASVLLLAIDRTLTRAWRRTAVVVFALVTYLPMVLRRPAGPLFYDELAHWGQTSRLLADGTAFERNIVPVLGDYPGLHVLSAVLVRVSGLDVWTVALTLICLTHLALVLGIVEAARALDLGDRVATAAGAIYALSPGFLFFTAIYAYESLAIVFQLWAVVIALRLLRAEPAQRRRLLAVGCVLAVAAALTHHLSAIVMSAMIVLLALLTVRSSTERAQRRAVALLAAVATLATVGWIIIRGGAVYSYLAVFPTEGLSQLSALLHPHHGSSATRSVFQGSGLPTYETYLSLLGVPLALSLAAVGAWALRRRLADARVRFTIVVALLYPVSLPFVLTSGGAPGAHRSWPFSWQALAILIALAIITLADGRHRLRARILAVCAISAALAVAVGAAASDFNAEARFPGVYENGVDGRMVTSESLALVTWMSQNLPRSSVFIASDIYTAGVVAAYTGQTYALSFPTWDLTFYTGPVKPSTVRRLASDGIDYLVIDTRVDTSPFRGGYYIDPNEPEANVRTSPISQAALDKLGAEPYLKVRYASAHFVVYQVVTSVAAHWPGSP